MVDVAAISMDQTRQYLNNRLRELSSRIENAEKGIRHIDDPLVSDDPDRALQVSNDNVLRVIDEAAASEIKAINAVLARIDKGLYGVCIHCHGDIPQQRLQAVPYALTCMACA